METFLSVLQNISLINNFLLLAFIIIFVFIFWREHANTKSPIVFSDLLVDEKTKKVSNTKIGQFLGIAFSSWIVMYFAQKVSPEQIATMFPWVFGTWLTYLVSATGIERFFGSKDKTEIEMKEEK